MAVEDLERIPSRSSAAILLALYRLGRATSRRVAEEAGVDMRTFWSRVGYWRRKGWVARDGPFWVLTELGRAMVEKYRTLLEELVEKSDEEGGGRS